MTRNIGSTARNILLQRPAILLSLNEGSEDRRLRGMAGFIWSSSEIMGDACGGKPRRRLRWPTTYSETSRGRTNGWYSRLP